MLYASTWTIKIINTLYDCLYYLCWNKIMCENRIKIYDEPLILYKIYRSLISGSNGWLRIDNLIFHESDQRSVFVWARQIHFWFIISKNNNFIIMILYKRQKNKMKYRLPHNIIMETSSNYDSFPEGWRW